MISTRGRYALRVMLDIAENSNGNFIPLDDIAKRQNISEKYLESILAVLTRAQILIGLRGKGGGYKLTKSPEEYTIRSILTVTEGSLAPVACLKEGAPACDKSGYCKTLRLWKGFYDVITDYFDGITLADLLDKPDDYSI